MSRFSLRTTALMFTLLVGAGLRADTVTGIVRDSAGLPINNVTLDFSGGITPISPTSNSSGIFSVTVPAGTYDITFVPASTAHAPIQILGVVVSGTANLGTVTLPNGFTLSGTALTSTGAPIALGDINVYDAVTGAKLYTPGDNTTTTGTFAVVVPAGTFHVRVSPPAGLIVVAQQIQNVVVAGNTSVGTITLPPGVQVTGTVRNAQTLAPLAVVDIDVDTPSGVRIITPSDDTNASGVFTVIVPTGTFTFSFSPPPGMLIVGAQIPNVVVGGNLNVGFVNLSPGFALSGTVRRPGNLPVALADIDVHNVLGSVRLFTPNDNTDVNGTFTVVVPAGNYRVNIDPGFASQLVAVDVGPIGVSGPATTGTVNLAAGVTLSGTVIGFNGLPLANADIDVLNPSTGLPISTPSDTTNAAGQYAVVVPPGTWNVLFQAPKGSLSRDVLIPGVNIPTATTLNATLSTVSLAVYMAQSPPAAPIPGTQPVLIDALIYNPTFQTKNAVLDMVMIDPAGATTSILTALPISWPGQFFFFWPSLSVPLPPLNPSHSGYPFKLQVRLTEVPSGLVLDDDEFSFIRL